MSLSSIMSLSQVSVPSKISLRSTAPRSIMLQITVLSQLKSPQLPIRHKGLWLPPPIEVTTLLHSSSPLALNSLWITLTKAITLKTTHALNSSLSKSSIMVIKCLRRSMMMILGAKWSWCSRSLSLSPLNLSFKLRQHQCWQIHQQVDRSNRRSLRWYSRTKRLLIIIVISTTTIDIRNCLSYSVKYSKNSITRLLMLI